MQIVDRVEIHVFGVPREGGFPHAEVEVGGVHTVDLDVVVLVHPVQDWAKILDVPVLKINGRNATLSNWIWINFFALNIEALSLRDSKENKRITAVKN